jgi:hypothetical protein
VTAGGLARTVLLPFAGREPMIAIAVAGALLGGALFLAFRKFANVAAMRILRRKLWAYVLGLYLFGDDPLLAIGSLGQLAKANLLLLLHAAPPLLVIAPVAALAIIHLNEFFSRTPLDRGRPAVLTVRIRKQTDPLPVVLLETPAWIAVDLPAVRVPPESEISWRIRATGAGRGLMKLTCGNVTVTKEIDTEPGPRYFGKTRTSSLGGWLLHPAEERLPDGAIESISLSETSAAIEFGGVTMHWISWLAAISFTVAWLLALRWLP